MRSSLPNLQDRLTGTLLGTALGDALGLPAEGMSAAAIRKRWGEMDSFHLLGRTGYVSDDTEQAALLAESLIRHPDDPERCAAAFRRALVAWFARLPFGVGLATVRASVRAMVGIRPSGVLSAGNGAAMRAAPVGVFFRDDAAARRAFGQAVAEVTHRDSRAVDGALYVAELAAGCARSTPDSTRDALVRAAILPEFTPALREALQQALDLAGSGASAQEAASRIGTSGYVLHSTAWATFAFLRSGDHSLNALRLVISAGGDTDSTGAIVGAWVGALHGEAELPALVERIHNGPFGPAHLRALASALAGTSTGTSALVPRFSAPVALARNLALMPVILAHGFRRLAPF
jgi:ADP-ribosyl-[dinitrogen reductase] hydrolase